MTARTAQMRMPRLPGVLGAGWERSLTLQELTRRKPTLKNRTAPEVEAIIVELSLDRPAYGQIRIANELRKLGHSISPAGVRGVWQRPSPEVASTVLTALPNASNRHSRGSRSVAHQLE
jgi:hypothetical protein